MTTPKNKGGRPKKVIDKKEFEKLCALQCTLPEFCGWFDCSEDTIERWCKSEYNAGFAEVFKLKRANGKISLRRSQWQLAEKNAAMAIFLGKQYLGQRDSFPEEQGENKQFKEFIEAMKNL